jgi:adenylosuccinate lyase
MIENLVGDQWNEGDVSCSATRRAAISGSFLVLDGILDTAIDLVNGLAVSEVSITNELNEEMPLIASSAYLMLMVEKGASREAAHKLLGEALRNYKENASNNREGLISALTSKSDSLLSEKDLLGVLSNPIPLTGLATSQCDSVLAEIDSLVAKVSGAAEYQPKQSI